MYCYTENYLSDLLQSVLSCAWFVAMFGKKKMTAYTFFGRCMGYLWKDTKNWLQVLFKIGLENCQ